MSQLGSRDTASKATAAAICWPLFELHGFSHGLVDVIKSLEVTIIGRSRVTSGGHFL